MSKERNLKINVWDIVLTVLCVLYFVGSIFVFGPCAAKVDGSFMTCHWAGQAVSGIAALLTVQSILRLLAKEAGKKQGIDLAMAATAILAFAVPGHLIGLCMMADMRCRKIMTPSVIVCSVLVCVFALIDYFSKVKKSEKK